MMKECSLCYFVLPDVYLNFIVFPLPIWQAYEEFVATFEETPVQKGKVWVKAGTFDAGSRSKYRWRKIFVSLKVGV